MSVLSAPVLTQVLHRVGTPYFAVGVCCLNGSRLSNEDAHCIHIGHAIGREDWGIFGIFDGHNGSKCSRYVAEHLPRAIERCLADCSGPLPTSEVQRICFEIDQKWLTTQEEGGSCATFIIVNNNMEGNRFVQVGNIGDSRVVLVRGGVVVDALTTDHKPNMEAERRRIEQCGGQVVLNRVDGGLAVSRAFGDAEYKTTGDAVIYTKHYNTGKSLIEQIPQKVIAIPDVQQTTLSPGTDDFWLLCCDGVFEADFTNSQVVQLAGSLMKTTNDLAAIAAAVCLEAEARGSKDNISCMVLQHRDGREYAQKYAAEECIPGPFSCPHDPLFVRAYQAMLPAYRSLPEALMQRHRFVKATLPGLLKKYLTVDPLNMIDNLTFSELRSMLRPKLTTQIERRDFYAQTLQDLRRVLRRKMLNTLDASIVVLPDFVEVMQKERDTFSVVSDNEGPEAYWKCIACDSSSTSESNRDDDAVIIYTPPSLPPLEHSSFFCPPRIPPIDYSCWCKLLISVAETARREAIDSHFAAQRRELAAKMEATKWDEYLVAVASVVAAIKDLTTLSGM